jgi:hypothetical protein
MGDVTPLWVLGSAAILLWFVLACVVAAKVIPSSEK